MVSKEEKQKFLNLKMILMVVKANLSLFEQNLYGLSIFVLSKLNVLKIRSLHH